MVKRFLDAHSMNLSDLDEREDHDDYIFLKFAERDLGLGMVVSLSRENWSFEAQQNERRKGRGGLFARRHVSGTLAYGEHSAEVRRTVDDIAGHRAEIARQKLLEATLGPGTDGAKKNSA